MEIYALDKLQFHSKDNHIQFFSGRDTRDDSRVMVEVCHCRSLAEANSFSAEELHLAEIVHPYVCKVKNVLIVPTPELMDVWVVSEHSDRTLMTEAHKLSYTSFNGYTEEQIIIFLKEAASGLLALQAKVTFTQNAFINILTPNDILIDSTEHYKLPNYGSHWNRNDPNSGMRKIIQYVRFLSPERRCNVIMGETEETFAFDIYKSAVFSLAALAIFMTVLSTLHDFDNARRNDERIQAMEKQLTKDGYSSKFRELLRHMLREKPDSRFDAMNILEVLSESHTDAELSVVKGKVLHSYNFSTDCWEERMLEETIDVDEDSVFTQMGKGTTFCCGGGKNQC